MMTDCSAVYMVLVKVSLEIWQLGGEHQNRITGSLHRLLIMIADVVGIA